MVAALSASLCLRARGTADPRRSIVFVAVVVAHAAALVLLSEDVRGPAELGAQQPPMVWLLLPSRSGGVSTNTTAAPRAPAATRVRSASAPPRSARPLPAPVEMRPPPVETPAAPRIDWQAETGSAVARQLARDAARDATTQRQESALAHPTAPESLTDAPRAPQFGWDYAATHRVEYTSRGALYVNLNDRCIYAFPILVLCKIGEGASAKGDLFQHARDAPTRGAQ